MTTKAGRRSIRTYEPEVKLEAIQRFNAGASKASVARYMGVPESTLRGWCKNEEKISYLSRHSSPKTDESYYPPKKRTKLDHSSSRQPLNLSLKPNGALPNSETNYDPDYMKYGDLMASLSTHDGLLAHWTVFLVQQQLMLNQSMNPPMISAAASGMNPYMWKQTHLPKERQSGEESVLSWLRNQQDISALTHLHNVRTVNGFSASSASTKPSVKNTNGIKEDTIPHQRSSPYLKMYKKESHIHFQAPIQEIPANNQQILFQYLNLTKAMSPEDERKACNNKTVTSTCNRKGRSVLDNSLFNKENVDPNIPKEGDILSQAEASKHGEMFLKWVETEMGITATKIMQIRKLLDNARLEPDDMPKRIKVKRK